MAMTLSEAIRAGARDTRPFKLGYVSADGEAACALGCALLATDSYSLTTPKSLGVMFKQLYIKTGVNIYQDCPEGLCASPSNMPLKHWVNLHNAYHKVEGYDDIRLWIADQLEGEGL